MTDEAEGYFEMTGRRRGVGHRWLAVGSQLSSRSTACEFTQFLAAFGAAQAQVEQKEELENSDFSAQAASLQRAECPAAHPNA